MKRNSKQMMKRLIFNIFKKGQQVGLNILPSHYYSSVANVNELEKTVKFWQKKSELIGLSAELPKQIENLKNICTPYESEYADNKIYLEGMNGHFGPGFGYIEAQALHAVIRHHKPKMIIEVGSGVSTYCSLKAAELNEVPAKVICIEPYPSETLKANKDIELIEKKVQEVPFDFFQQLKENDLLFIDSSHTVKTGGDVNYLILEILPRLNKGVIVHFHDIYLPYDYQRDILKNFFQWSETTLLRAFLTFNSKFSIIFCFSMLHYSAKDELKRLFSHYEPQDDFVGLQNPALKPFETDNKHFPCSLYLLVQ